MHTNGLNGVIIRHVYKCWPPRNLVIRHGCLFPISIAYSVKPYQTQRKNVKTLNHAKLVMGNNQANARSKSYE